MCLNKEYIFKIASSDSEFEQIHDLNYKTFVEEIPQHEQNGCNNLVDKFHGENTYIISLKEGELVGMIAVRDKRPFSLDCKLGDIDIHLPAYRSACEIRLLSIKREYRKRKVLSGLFSRLSEYCENNGYDIAVISANVDQLGLYKKLGFSVFADIVGKNGALYQPMYLTFDSYSNFKDKTSILEKTETKIKNSVNLLPGPAPIDEDVRKAFESAPVSHRSEKFTSDFNATKKLLLELTGAKCVELFMGSGTLANDVIAGEISKLEKKGVVLSNGHFGERLVDHCERFSLDFDFYFAGWGMSFDLQEVENLLANYHYGWLWFVHCETSTGVENNVGELKKLTGKYGVKLCVDCVSSIGTHSFSLDSVYLASGVSGKALCSYPGISFVFYNHVPDELKKLPRYTDLYFYRNSGGIPFTFSSNLLYALKKALENTDTYYRRNTNTGLMVYFRKKLFENGIQILSGEDHFSPDYVTFRSPFNTGSPVMGERLEQEGFTTSYRSDYLLQNGLLQIALFGKVTENELDDLIFAMKRIGNESGV